VVFSNQKLSLQEFLQSNEKKARKEADPPYKTLTKNVIY
jgi:hypothetical protein